MSNRIDKYLEEDYSPDKFARDSSLGQLILLVIIIIVLLLVIK